MCLECFTREVSRSHLSSFRKAALLTLIFRAQTYFGRLYPPSCSFGRYPNLLWARERKKIDWQICLSAQQSLTTTDLGRIHIIKDSAPIRLLISRSIFFLTHEQNPELIELFHLGQALLPDPEKSLHLFPPADSHPGCFTLSCEPIQ